MVGNCAIIVCDHGLGHVRRCALMAKEREKTGEQVTLFAPRASVERVQHVVPSIAGLLVEDFDTRTSPERVRRGLPEAIEWIDRLPDLDAFDTVICDNLPEILELRADAMISAQFFWHDVIERAGSDYVEYCGELLANCEPTVIGCELFSMDIVRRQPGFRPVGLYQTPELIAAVEKTRNISRNDLLVTGGSTDAVFTDLKEVIAELLRDGPGEYSRVHVDSELFPERAPDWIQKADFSTEMYCSLKAAICRPGLGVVTDLLTVGARISTVFETGNRELENNARIIDALYMKN